MLRKYFKYIFPIILIMGVLPFVFIKKDKDTLSLLEEKDMLAYTIDGVSVGSSNMPAKGSGYVVSSITCKNGSKLVWDNDNWELEMVTLEDFDSCVIDFTTDKTKSSTMVTLTSTESLVDKVDSTSKTATVQTPITFYVTTGYKPVSVDSCSSSSSLTSNKVIFNNVSSNQNCTVKINKVYTLAEAILRDNPTVSERTSFTSTNVDNTTGTIYKTNKTNDESYVYYYSGNTTNNWVKFGKYTDDKSYYKGYASAHSNNYLIYYSLDECTNATSYNVKCTETNLWKADDDIYWRIIRTNEDESVRLLYVGPKPNTTTSYIGLQVNYNLKHNNQKYVGYMYGEEGSLESVRTNTNSSNIKQYVDNWYAENLLSYDKYVSKDAIYCNDRSIGSGNFAGNAYYAAYNRVYAYKMPSYKCGANNTNGLYETTQSVADKFNVSGNNGGNGQLTYPIALVTSDELAFAGGLVATSMASPYAWYHANSENTSTTDMSWWTMTPYSTSISSALGWLVWGSDNPGTINYFAISTGTAVRPVISLSPCVRISGTGTSTDPYVLDQDASSC